MITLFRSSRRVRRRWLSVGLLLTVPALGFAQTIRLHDVVSCAGGKGASASFSFTSTAGQGPTGAKATGTTLALRDGFWATVVAPVELCDSWRVTLRVAEGSVIQRRHFGEDHAGTANYDAGIDSLIPPPGFSFYSYFRGTPPWLYLSCDMRSCEPDSVGWRLTVTNSSANYTISWDPQSLPPCHEVYIDGTNMRQVSQIVRDDDWTFLLYAKRTPPQLAVSVPNGGESWTMGTQQLIQWSRVCLDGGVRVEWSRNNGGSWEPLTELNGSESSWQWTVQGPEGPDNRVRIVSTQDPTVMDMSDQVFTINDPASSVPDASAFPARLTLRVRNQNPSRGELTLDLGLASPGEAAVDLYSADGRLIESILRAKLPAGWCPVTLHRATVGGHPVSTGVYFVQARSGSERTQKKIVFVR